MPSLDLEADATPDRDEVPEGDTVPEPLGVPEGDKVAPLGDVDHEAEDFVLGSTLVFDGLLLQVADPLRVGRWGLVRVLEPEGDALGVIENVLRVRRCATVTLLVADTESVPVRV